MKHLVALVADKNMEFALKGLLTRHASLGMRPIEADIFVHPQRDPGCLLYPHAVLGPLHHGYERALVLFDREGCGREHETAIELGFAAEQRLAHAEWADRVAAVVIDPELEAWVWADSPHVDRVLGWAGRNPSLRSWLVQTSRLLGEHVAKPLEPKESVDEALRLAGKPRSSALYEDLARAVTLAGCTDPAFQRLRGLLRSWFPAEAAP